MREFGMPGSDPKSDRDLSDRLPREPYPGEKESPYYLHAYVYSRLNLSLEQDHLLAVILSDPGREAERGMIVQAQVVEREEGREKANILLESFKAQYLEASQENVYGIDPDAPDADRTD